jgi:predicted metalloenzyme YecM
MQKLIGDYRGFFALQKERLAQSGIDISGMPVSHLAIRTESMDEYLRLRGRLERHCTANVENVWNGRPISKMLLQAPLDLGDGFKVSLLELIPPKHLRVYQMGLEHVGIVVGDKFDEFSRTHRARLTGQQFQSTACEPVYIRFDDDTHVKFYRESLMDVCIREGQSFEGFSHAV